MPDQVRHDDWGARMKQISVWPMLIMLVGIVFIILWLSGFFE
ncbi:MAG: hypothetical protein ABIO68_04825 [Sphingomicrobium sp.]